MVCRRPCRLQLLLPLLRLAAAQNEASCNVGSCDSDIDEEFIKLAISRSVSVDDVDEFDMILEKARDAMTYENPNEQWPAKHPDCGSVMQSPIDIVSAKVHAGLADAKNLSYNAALSKLNLLNNGHYLQVNGHFGTLDFRGDVYEAKHFKFHFPSEHRVNGHQYAGEMHVVHQRRDARGTDGLAIVAILLEQTQDEKVGEQDFFEKMGFASKLPTAHRSASIDGKIDLDEVLKRPLEGDYWVYDGSLTTPPCSQTVRWIVLENSLMVSKPMVETVKHLFPNPMNNRPLQAMNGRNVSGSGKRIKATVKKVENFEDQLAKVNHISSSSMER